MRQPLGRHNTLLKLQKSLDTKDKETVDGRPLLSTRRSIAAAITTTVTAAVTIAAATTTA
jgi:hypothetical protein